MNASEKRATVALGSIFAMRMLGLFMIVPVFAVYGKHYAGATPFLIGLAIGIYGLGQAIFQIPMSVLSDKMPRKPIIVVGLAMFALGGAIAASASNIYMVIVGRALAGSGAISAVIMALLADVTREQERSKAMAAMGFTIAFSIMGAFILGPVLTGLVGISGLFWLTCVAGVLAMFMLLFVPSPTRVIHQYDIKLVQQFKQVLSIADINRLHVSIFALHLTMTAMFVLLPAQLNSVLGLDVKHQGYVYLPLLFLGFVVSVPFIIIAEKKRNMRRVFLTALVTLVVALASVAVLGSTSIGLIVGLAIYFMGFNLLEATIPSWISKRAPAMSKATAMGLNATSQFLGAFVGGALGGVLLTQSSVLAWGLLAGIAGLAFLLIIPIHEPPYLTSLTVSTSHVANTTAWSAQLLAIAGVEEVVLVNNNQTAYVKLDKKAILEDKRQTLSQLCQQTIDF